MSEETRLQEVEARALRIISYRDHATEELRRKLIQRKFPRHHIETVIARFSDLGYLDDAAFAVRQTRLLADKEWGPYQIRRKLGQRGIATALIDRAIDGIDPQIWLQQAKSRLQSKFGFVFIEKSPSKQTSTESFRPPPPSQEEKAKAFRHLVYRGFSQETVRRALFDELT